MEKLQKKTIPAVVVIPALNPDTNLPSYVGMLLERGILAVVVVDDGSAAEYSPVFTSLEGIEGCTVLRHAHNQGKGRAMKTAFAYIARQEQWRCDGVVTADADGQHIVEDVLAVAAALGEEKNRIVMGVRDLRLPSVPFRSKVGNRLTSLAYRFLYGVRLEDTQTGLRGIPWGLLEWCGSISGERYEYEMNMLIRASRDRIGLRQVPITVVYIDNNKGSHLKAGRDSWRVFCVLIAGLGIYTLCSVVSAATDVFMFWLCSSVIFAFLPPAVCYWWSVVLARAVSSLVDYTLNHLYFTSKKNRGSLERYYCLWFCQMLCSYGLLMAMRHLFPALPAVVSKALMDILLAVASYQIQLHWVFRRKEEYEAG